MSTLETFLLNYALNATWQIPVVFAAAWLAARLSRRLGPPFQHRLSVSTFVVEVFLPACSVQPAPALRTLQYWLLSFTRSDLHSTGHVTVTMGPVHAEGGLQLPPALLAAVALLYLGSILFFAAKLSVGLYRTMRLRRHARPITLSGHASQSYQRLERLFCIKGSLLATSPEIAVPMTMGVRHRMLMLPAGTEADLTGEDLDAALAHEFAHMRRYDFAKNLLYQMLSSRSTRCYGLHAAALQKHASSSATLLQRRPSLAAKDMPGPCYGWRRSFPTQTSPPSPKPSESSMPTTSRTLRGELCT
jgi:Zn-dependent protease with chaperone function